MVGGVGVVALATLVGSVLGGFSQSQPDRLQHAVLAFVVPSTIGCATRLLGEPRESEDASCMIHQRSASPG